MSENLSPKALNDLGDKFFYGKETAKNIELAYTYYKQAADSGNPIGLFNVGKYFLVKDEFKKAVEYLQKALLSGYSKAYLLLANMSLEGKGMRKSKKKAFKYTQDGTKLQDTDAFNQLAYFYQKGIGCAKDERKTWEYYQMSADKNNAVGMYQLGLLHLLSPKGKSNPETALHWLDKASQSGMIEAINKVITIYSDPHPYFKKRSQTFLDEMIFYYQELKAKQNDLPALEKVAIDYLEGSTVTKKNYEKAAEYFQVLVKIDNTIGYYGSGVCNLFGYGMKVNPEIALQELTTAANRGYEKAMTKLGEMYKLGIQTKADPEQAKKWYYEAAKQNAPEALVNLGLLHYKNEILNASNELAFQYMENALKKGSVQASYWMGIFREKGIGCDKNLSMAEKHYQKAIAQGLIASTYKYGVMLYESGLAQKSKGKAAKQFQKARNSFLDYVNFSQKAIGNAAYSCYFLGLIYEKGLGVIQSLRISRYWYETSSELGYGKAMTKMFHILKNSEFNQAMKWLEKASLEVKDPEAYYELGLLYLNNEFNIPENKNKAKTYLEIAANLNFKPAIDRLMML